MLRGNSEMAIYLKANRKVQMKEIETHTPSLVSHVHVMALLITLNHILYHVVSVLYYTGV